jgi:hypothetical protein
MLLGLDQGSMTAYEGGERPGVLATNGGKPERWVLVVSTARRWCCT